MSAQQKFFTISIILLSGVLSTNMIFAQTLIYKNIISGKDFNSKTVISKTDNGYHVKSTINKAEHIYNTDLSFSVLKWKYNNSDEATDLVAERSGNIISITGLFKNKKYEKKLDINELPWYEAWGLGLKAFINSDKDSSYFWSIDPKSMRIAKFEARKEKTEKIIVNNREFESVYVTVNLTGFIKMFWGGGKMWFRKSDGTCILSKMNPKVPEDITQLIDVK